VLYGLVREHLAEFLEHASDTYERGLPRYVVGELEAYLRCGVFAHGFIRCHCDACGHDLLVAFSCKGRGACPSCGAGDVPPNVEIEQRSSASSRSIRGHVHGAIELGVVSA
jgi:hypothetical protein